MNFARDLINNLIKKNNYQTYLEIGIDTGVTFNSIQIKNKESVDPALDNYFHAQPTYKMTSDEFFKNHKSKKYDIIFIDGLHHSDQVDKDIFNSINSLNENGFVVLHDCLPINEKAQIIPRQTNTWNGDVWKSIVKYRSSPHSLGCRVVDFDFGIGIISNQIPIETILSPKNLTYKEFSKDTKNYLGLISIKEFTERYL
jgi:hypothetical protein